MPKLIRNTCACLLLLGFFFRLGAAPPYTERELLVKWRDAPASDAAALGNAQIGSTVKRNFNAVGWQLVELPPGLSVRDGIAAYQALESVLAVQPNGTVVLESPPRQRSNDEEGLRIANSELRTEPGLHGLRAPDSLTPVVPNDPMFSQQWYLKKISATNAWAITTGSSRH